MRANREQMRENRRTILEAAGRLFRERGFEAVTVTDVMKSAGLTHGGFYAYFKSKDCLIAETLAELLGGGEPLSSDFPTLAAQYLTPEHRDNFAYGCPTAALASDAIRQPGSARSEMTVGLRRQIERFSEVAPGKDQTQKRRAAIGNWSAMVGALILARMSGDLELSNEVLRETRSWLSAQVDEPETY
ncbi:helix-turn-helix domain-containing protein (plasmid) [Agrobacterium leguminum]|uniref:TetR/AcrR family transcriptional regulator n=1 Tax=Agrobacterium leguminum TaxID=2792015 RepID=UPI0030D23968